MTEKTEVQSGNTVRVHYRGTLENGSEFDSSFGRKPLEFKVGSEQVIPGFDNALIGMSVGDKKKVVIPPEEAYGSVRSELIFKVPVENVPSHIKPVEGIDLLVDDGAGGKMKVSVKEITDNHLVLDGNHTLAGKTLIFELELDSIVG